MRIELRDTAASLVDNVAQYQLMLRTNEAVIVYEKKTAHFIEIPRDQVRRIVHDVGGMRSLPYELPTKVNRWTDR